MDNKLANFISCDNEHNKDQERNDESFEDEKKRNKRRSKNDNDGRSYKCQHCGKAYLSYPALYTHIKTKHSSSGQTSTRGRGRPKKDIGEINSLKLLYNPNTFEYFKHHEKIGETHNISKCIEGVFTELYQNIDRFNKKNYSSYKDHPFFSNLIEQNISPKSIDVDNSKCDEIFADYLIKVSKICREEFFVQVLKFITLFRECMNIQYKNRRFEMNSLEYSEIMNAEDAPDISNEFVTEFLDWDKNPFGLSKDNAIDLTQNLCQWLYDNNYTCSKLSLVNNY